MSVLITVKVTGDTDAFQRALVDRASDFKAVAERGQREGAIHHRFGIGDGYILVVDEWETAEQFEQFFGSPELQEFVGSVGGAPMAPEITVTQAISSPDEF
jgi:hypothetical protein